MVCSSFIDPKTSRTPMEAEGPTRRGEREIASVRIRRREAPYVHPLRATEGVREPAKPAQARGALSLRGQR